MPKPLKVNFKSIGHQKTAHVELYDSHHLQLPKSKAVSFIDNNHMILECNEESPASRPHLKIKET